ncbi:MAG TPA: hypothetical protein VGW11_08115 [Solirubrobacteraceae bacterium]|nr:hypothetical protein [Solirubrobacteraceae bacterium]
MADKRTDAESDVLNSLPSSRPARRSAKREARSTSGPAAKPVPPAGYATPAPERTSPGTGELLGGTVRAAGEVAQQGVGAGARLVKGTLRRLTGR